MSENCVGTGAFQIKNVVRGEVVMLEKNNEYWKNDEYGNKLPYLDFVKFSFIKEKNLKCLNLKEET